MLPGTGRRIVLDDGQREMNGDLKHLMHARRMEAASVTSRYWATTHPPLDQGYTSQCVVYSFDKYLTTSPVKNIGFNRAAEREKIYKEVQKLDEWPGEDYDGTSVRAMMKWAQKNGYIKDYHWAFTVQAVIDHVLVSGPVCMGTVWDDMMMGTDKYGYIESSISEADDQGHAWLIIGADRDKVHPITKDVGAVRGLTSWGDWGKDRNSRFWVSFKELNKLISLAGEAAVANEIRKV